MHSNLGWVSSYKFVADTRCPPQFLSTLYFEIELFMEPEYFLSLPSYSCIGVPHCAQLFTWLLGT